MPVLHGPWSVETLAAAPPAADQLVHVTAGPDEGERVALFERHPLHPGGECYVAGQNQAPQEVATTPAVLAAYAASRLTVVVPVARANVRAEPAPQGGSSGSATRSEGR